MDVTKINRILGKIETDIREKTNNRTDYKTLEEVCLETLKMPLEKIEKYSPLKYDQMISMVYDFFGTSDQRFCDQAAEVLNNNPELRVYNGNNINPNNKYYSQFEEGDRFPLFDRAGIVYSNKTKERRIYLPYYENMGDVYRFCHEIAHTFDYHAVETSQRDFLAEITPFIFDKQLDDYLMARGYGADVIIHRNRRKDDDDFYADRVLPIAILRNTMTQYNELNYDNVKKYVLGRDKICEQFNVSEEDNDWFIRTTVGKILPSHVKKMDVYVKYILAQAVSIQVYQNYDKDKLFDYIENVGKVGIADSLQTLDFKLEPEEIISTINDYYEDEEKPQRHVK